MWGMGIAAGAFSFLLGVALGRPLPALDRALYALALGAASYGASISLFVLSLRRVSAARTGVLFGLAPFAGVALSLAIFQQLPAWSFFGALALMALAAILLARERHGHLHLPQQWSTPTHTGATTATTTISTSAIEIRLPHMCTSTHTRTFCIRTNTSRIRIIAAATRTKAAAATGELATSCSMQSLGSRVRGLRRTPSGQHGCGRIGLLKTAHGSYTSL